MSERTRDIHNLTVEINRSIERAILAQQHTVAGIYDALSAADALVADYLKVRARLSITRTVVVQPSTYGTDNSCTLDGMAQLGSATTRGVAVVEVRHRLATEREERQRPGGGGMDRGQPPGC